jgi:hypothetical protein
MHRHGCYLRYLDAKGDERVAMQRFLCPPCGHTVSVLPSNQLTYRPLKVKRLEAYFDAQAGVSTGLDPPPELTEAGCLQRAWNRFLTRVDRLKNAFGQMLRTGLNTAGQLWKEMRQSMGSGEQILRFLAQNCKCSLLGDYACLRPAH